MLFKTNVVRQSKRRGHTTLRSIAMVANVTNRLFLQFETLSNHYFYGSKPVKSAFFTMIFELQIAVKNFLHIKHTQNKCL